MVETSYTHESQLELLRLLENEPQLSQRQLAERLGISLGKTNYLLQALLEKGHVKAGNFRRSRNKAAYAYLLTPSGIEEKARLTLHFLERKRREYEELRRQISELEREAGEQGGEGSA